MRVYQQRDPKTIQLCWSRIPQNMRSSTLTERLPIRKAHDLPIPHPPNLLVLLVFRRTFLSNSHNAMLDRWWSFRLRLPKRRSAFAPNPGPFGTDALRLGLALPECGARYDCARIFKEAFEHPVQRACQVLSSGPRWVQEPPRRAQEQVRLGGRWSKRERQKVG